MQIDGINPNTSSFQVSSNLSNKELDSLVKLISSRLGVSEFTASRVLRKFMGTGSTGSFMEIKDFLTQFLENTSNTRQVNELATDLQSLQNNPKAQEQNFKPIIARLQYGLNQAQQSQSQASANNFVKAEQDRFVGLSQAKVADNPASALVQSPKLFASWLVNNKAAFILLRSNPEAANLLLALQNPQITKSPMMLSQISVLIAQLLKLKAGKSLTEDFDDVRKDELDKQNQTEASDYESNIVNTVKQGLAANKVDTVKDFLLEAERFAEEEIANLWSLTLKKEKELENKIKSGFSNFKKKK
jgi:hypothetical protein